MSDWIALGTLIVQFLGLIGLTLYAWATWRIREASQEQAEAPQKPCLTLVTAAREYDEAVLEMNGAVGGMIVAARQGNVALLNMGSGVAINVRYEFKPLNPPQNANMARPNGYLQNIAAGEIFVLQLTREVLRNLEYEFFCTYESLSGRKYESTITLSNASVCAH